MAEAQEAVTTRKNTLFTNKMKTRRLISVSSETT